MRIYLHYNPHNIYTSNFQIVDYTNYKIIENYVFLKNAHRYENTSMCYYLQTGYYFFFRITEKFHK